MGKRLKTNLALATAVLLVSGALVVPTGVIAQALQSCTTTNTYTLTPKPSGGNWPIPVPPTGGGAGGATIYRWDYQLSSTVGVNNVQVALNKNVKVVSADGVTADTNLQPACAGGVPNNNNFGLDVCDVQIYVWPSTQITSTLSFYTPAAINAHGPVGGCSVKKTAKSSSVGYGFPLEVPIAAPPEFASVLLTEVIKVDGVPYCIPLGPNGCPTGDPPFNCTDPNNPGPPLPRENLTFVDSNNVSHVPIWFQGTAENPACTRGQFFVNASCHYIYVGGTPYKVC